MVGGAGTATLIAEDIDAYLDSLLQAFLAALADFDPADLGPYLPQIPTPTPPPSYDPGNYVGTGTLARTGSDTTVLVLVAVGLLAVGSGFVLAARRRSAA